MTAKLRDLFIGKPLSDDQLSGEKFRVLWGLPIYSSDTISSVAYAGEEVLVVLLPVAFVLARIGFASGNDNLVWLSFPIAEIISLIVSTMLFRKLNRNLISKGRDDGVTEA